MKNLSIKNNKGQVMLLTVLVLGGTVMAAAFLVSSLIVYKIRQATDVGSSARAVFAADAGTEYELFRGRSGGISRSCPVFLNNAGFQTRVEIMDGQAFEIISIGSASNIIRVYSRIYPTSTLTDPVNYPTIKNCP